MSMKFISVTLENIEKYVEEKINEDKETHNENILMKIILFPQNSENAVNQFLMVSKISCSFHKD